MDTEINSILAIGDNQSVRDVRQILVAEDFLVVSANSDTALREFSTQIFGFVILLIPLEDNKGIKSHKTGLDLLEKIREINGTIPILILAKVNDNILAVECLRLGASDFIVLPKDNIQGLKLLYSRIEQIKTSKIMEDKNVK